MTRSPWFQRLIVSGTGVLLLAASLIALNAVAAFLPLRFDITNERIYTLSEGTERILANLPEPVTIKYYYSESLPNTPLQVKNYARKVREVLEGYDSAGGEKLRLEIYDPKPDTEDEEWAYRYGVQQVNLPDGSNLSFGMVAIAGEREAAVPFFDLRREKFLEYDVSEAITRVMRKDKPSLGILAFLPLSGQQDPTRPASQEWAVSAELRKAFKVQYLLPNIAKVPDDIDLLMLVHPKFLPNSALYAVDQFVLRGGRLMVFNDANARTDAEGMQTQGIRLTSSNIPDLLTAWGVQFVKNKVIGDMQLATRVNTQQSGVVDFPIWITFHGQYVNRDTAITSQLDELTFVDGGAFSTMDGFKYTWTPLLTTSTSSGEVDTFLAQMAGPLDIAKNLTIDNKPRVMAALLTGTFETAFPNGPAPDTEADTPKAPATPPPGHLAKGSKETSILLVGDADFMADHFSVETVNLFGRRINQPINDNLIFVLNAVEYLSGNPDLISIRSRGTFSRPFTTVVALQQAAQARYQAEEKELSAKLDDVQKRLQELQASGPKGPEGSTQSARLILTPEILKEVEKFREEERQTQVALREVRKVLRQDIENLGRTLLAINLLAMPILVAVFGFTSYYRRIKRSGGRS